MFSESELAFLAFLAVLAVLAVLAFLAFLAFVSFFIVFLGRVTLGRGRIDSSAGRRPNVENKIKGVTLYHCRNNQHKKRRGPGENDDDEPYNRRSTLFRCDYSFDVIKCFWPIIKRIIGQKKTKKKRKRKTKMMF